MSQFAAVPLCYLFFAGSSDWLFFAAKELEDNSLVKRIRKLSKRAIFSCR